MTEAQRAADQPQPSAPRSAGALLREARQAQGTHIAVLAAAIKVSQRKLEALEGDRYDELPDATFTRALANTVCRSLKIDPEPVLALLPQHQVDERLAHVSQGINARFRDAPGRHETRDTSAFASPAVWGPALLIVGAVAVYFWPQSWTRTPQAGSTPAPAVIAAPEPQADAEPAPQVQPQVQVQVQEAPAPATAEAPGVAPVDAQPAVPVAEAPVAAHAVPADGSELTLHARAPSWVEVVDARSTVLVSRLLQAGESVALDGTAPFRVRVGNASGTELVFRGQPVDLTAAARDNVARVELK